MSGTRRRPGRLGPFVEGFRVWLLEAGYTPQTVRGMLKELGSLGRWMNAEDVEVGALTVCGIESFLVDHEFRSWWAFGGRFRGGCPVFPGFLGWLEPKSVGTHLAIRD